MRGDATWEAYQCSQKHPVIHSIFGRPHLPTPKTQGHTDGSKRQHSDGPSEAEAATILVQVGIIHYLSTNHIKLWVCIHVGGGMSTLIGC